MHKRMKKILRVVFIPAYCLLAMEFFLRIFAPVPMLPRYVCATENGIRGNEPDKSYWHRTPEYKIHIETNSKGVRAAREFPYAKPEGVNRIVVLGDSFGMGYGVSLADSFTNQAKVYLEEKGYRIEIINLSVSGHGNAEQLILLEAEGLRYNPDLVLLQWHSTDRLDNVRSGLYRLKNDRFERMNSSYLPGVKTREFLFQFRVYQFIAEHSHFYNFFREWAAKKVKSILVAVQTLDSDSVPSAEQVEAAEDYRQKLTLRIIGQMQAVSGENGASFILLDIPRIRGREYFWSVFPWRDDVDLTIDYYSPILDFEKYAGQKLYWEKSHGHLTPLGCQIVGEGLGQYIIEHDLLD
jgi:hypothetical protein